MYTKNIGGFFPVLFHISRKTIHYRLCLGLIGFLALGFYMPVAQAGPCIGNGCTDLTTADGAFDSTTATVTNDIFSGSTYNAVISGTGVSGISLSVTDTGANGHVFALTGTNTYSGSTQILANATLSLTAESNIGNSSGIAITSGTLQLAGNTNITQALIVSTGSIIDTGANTDTYSGAISGAGGLTKNGTGSLTLSAANSFAGTLTVGAGTLVLTNSNAYAGGTVVNSGGILSTASNAFLGTGGITLNSGTLQLTGNTNITQTMALTGNGIADVGTNTDTYSGAISGAGGLTKNGTGSLTLSAANSFAGTLTVGAGTLVLTNSNAYAGGTVVNSGGILSTASNAFLGTGGITLNSGTLRLTGNTNITQTMTLTGNSIADVGTNTDTYSGVIGGAGNLTKNGTGSLILTNVDTYSGTTNIAAGTLQLDGTSASSTITVASGATLKGTGTALGNVINNGIVAPGDSPGTLTINGNYTGTGALDTELTGSNAAGNYDKLAVLGTATISSQTLNYFPLAPSPASKYIRGTTYQILTATAGVAGRFTNAPDGSIITATSTGANAGNAATIAASSDPALALQTNYNSNGTEVDTTIVRAEFFGAAPGATVNEAAVGRALDPLQLTATSGDMNTVLNALSAVPTAQQATALNMLTGEVNAQVQSTFRESQRDFDGMLGKRLGGDCDDTSNTANPGLVSQRQVIGGQGSKVAAWGCAYGSTAHVSGDSNAGNSDTTFIGGAGGYEFKPSDLTLVRVGAGYNNASLTATSTAASADLNSYQAGIYGQYNFYDKAYIGGSFAGSYNNGDTSRDIAFGSLYRKAKGNPDGYGLSGTALLGYAAKVDTVSFNPLASLEYIYNHQNPYTESGAGAADLYVHDKGTSALRTSLGAQISKIFDVGHDMTFTPEGRAAFIYDAFALAPSIDQNFAGTAAGFNVGGPNPGRAGFQGGLGGTLAVKNNLALFADYDGTFKANETDHRILGGLKFTW